jgi:hypothetical protein
LVEEEEIMVWTKFCIDNEKGNIIGHCHRIVCLLGKDEDPYPKLRLDDQNGSKRCF